MRKMSTDQKIKFITLGCKVNQYETQGMREDLHRSGIVEDRKKINNHDFVVINTCTVTEQADKESRYWIRRMRRENPEAKIVVTGCYVEKNRKEIEALEGVDLVLSNHEKADLSEHLVLGCGSPVLQDEEELRKRKRAFTPLKISTFQGNGRAFIKVQDGCNHSCSFCKTVLVRGRSRSREVQDVYEEAVRLKDAGYREIVFTGIQLGAYGLDLGKKDALSEVLEKCSEIEGIERLRLSSIEPTDVKDSLIHTIKSLPKACHHLHIPLQSGDSEILKKMNRRYEASFYVDLVEKLRKELPRFSLSLDVMAGFVGETEEQFENTLSVLKKTRPLKSHVFPYSPREGTRAYAYEGHLSIEEIRERSRRMMAIADDLGFKERYQYVGQMVNVLVEKKIENSGLVQGLTDNYLKVCFQANEDQIGEVLPVELLSLEGDTFLGRYRIH